MQIQLDRTFFTKGKQAETASATAYWLTKSYFERLCAAWYLTCSAYNLPYISKQPLDRSVFTMKKR